MIDLKKGLLESKMSNMYVQGDKSLWRVDFMWAWGV